MRLNFILFTLCCLVSPIIHAQDEPTSLINIGDPAPPLFIKSWLKGTPVQNFEKGKVYVLEFWATWCGPCLAAMPHLSVLAEKYKDSITVIGIDVYEKKTMTIKRLKAFVDSLGSSANYRIAAEDSNFMVENWLVASREKDNGIPRTFVIDREGRITWIGHPMDLEQVLPEIVNNTWNIQAELLNRNENTRLKLLDDSVRYMLQFAPNGNFRTDKWRKDSSLLIIFEVVDKEPKLKYTPSIASITFTYLLESKPLKAYEYGKEFVKTKTYEQPNYSSIFECINWYFGKINLPLEIYELGIEAYQAEINSIPYPKLVNIPKRYNKMAELYWLLCNKQKAIESQQKAIDVMTGNIYFSESKLKAYKDRLKEYINSKP